MSLHSMPQVQAAQGRQEHQSSILLLRLREGMRNQLLKGLTLDDPRRSFIKLIERMTHSRRSWQIFADFCEMTACAYTNVAPHRLNEKREARYLEVARQYTADEMQGFCFLNACVVEAMEQKGFDDVLGSIFMEMELASHWHGQFFTPYCISSMMSRVTLDAAARDMEIIRWMEPACGAGAMMIAVAEALHEIGVNPQQTLHTQAIDIDPLCVHMAVIQLSVLGLPAVVHHGNTLSGERWDQWVTPAHVLGMWDWKLKRADARVLTLSDEAQGAVAPSIVEASIEGEKEIATTGNEVSQLALF